MQARALKFLKFDQNIFSTSFDPNGYINYPNQAWRSDNRSPDKIQLANGFEPRGSNTYLERHVGGFGGYVAYGQSLWDATRFCKPYFQQQFGSYLYQTEIPKIHVDVRESPLVYKMMEAGVINYAKTENELAAATKMEWKGVNQARHYFALPSIGAPYVFFGPLIKNPDYQACNWSIQIPSINEGEAEQFEKDLRLMKRLPDGSRVLSLAEAKTLVAPLEEVAKHYDVSPSSKHFRLKFVPTNCKGTVALVNHALDQYKQFNAVQGIKMTSQSIYLPAVPSLVSEVKVSQTNQGLFALSKPSQSSNRFTNDKPNELKENPSLGMKK